MREIQTVHQSLPYSNRNNFSIHNPESCEVPMPLDRRKALPAPCAIFWDFENCAPPTGMPGYVVVESIRNVVHTFGHIVLFKAYLEISESTSKILTRSQLQSSGVSLTDCPHNGRKDAVDKMLMVDMLAFAIDNPAPATIVLISGDKDFVYALGVLRNRMYNMVLIAPGKGASVILKSQVNTVLEWRFDVLNQELWDTQKELRARTSIQNRSLTTSPAFFGAPGDIISGIDVSMEAVYLDDLQLLNALPAESETELKLQSDSADSTLSDFDAFCTSQKPPGFFDSLVEVLEKLRVLGYHHPRRSKVGYDLLCTNPLLYNRDGCSSFKEYVELSVKEGIVDIGGSAGLAWMCLKSRYQSRLYKPAELTCEDNTTLNV